MTRVLHTARFSNVEIMVEMVEMMVLTFKSMDETLVCDHLNKSYRVVLSCGAVYYAVHGGPNF